MLPTATDRRKLEGKVRLRHGLNEGQPLAVGSVSTGLGILALAMHEGLEAAGLRSDLKFAVDIEPAYLEQCAKANAAWGDGTIAVEAPMQELAFDASALLKLPKEIGRAHVELQSLMRISYAVFCWKKTK